MRPLIPLLVTLCVGAGALAQAPVRFRVRLSTVPIDVAMQKTVAGSGAVEAELTGRVLTVTGMFKGLVTPATVARLHEGPVKGVRGPEIHELNPTKGTEGTIRATLTLSDPQVAALKGGRLYIQLHSEGAPDGNLWGWLLPLEVRR